MDRNTKLISSIIIASVLVSSVVGATMGFLAGRVSGQEGDAWHNLQALFVDREPDYAVKNTDNVQSDKIKLIEEESVVIDVVESASPAVVSIVVTKDLPVIERYYRDPYGDNDFFRRFFGDDFGDFFSTPEYRENGTETREIGGGTGFLVSSDGYIITNKHVVFDDEADYTVIMNDESRHEAEVLAKDAFNDIAVIKIEGGDLPFIDLGDSSNLKVGQKVVTIGNSLGEFQNTVSTGIVSGLARDISASGRGIMSEELIDVIQTDAAINPGNSGGPLLNILGQAIGINTAIAQGAENIGFALPINAAKDVYESVREHGKIVRPWLGVRYVILNERISDENNLEVDYGALILRGEERTDFAVIPGSPADRAGLVENDIILEVDGKTINEDYPLSRAVGTKKPGDQVSLKILHKGEEKELDLTLEEMDGGE